MTDFLTPLPKYEFVHILTDSLPVPQLRMYLMEGLFLNHKTNKIIWNIDIWKKKLFTKK